MVKVQENNILLSPYKRNGAKLLIFIRKKNYFIEKSVKFNLDSHLTFF